MKTLTISDEYFNNLIKLAQSTAWGDDDDFAVDDYAGGNIDDAYYGGECAGEIGAARSLLTAAGIKWYD